MFGYNLVSEERNKIWKVVVSDETLKNKDGSIMNKVNEFADVFDNESNESWDIIFYKDMVAFKLPTERKTYIYSKKYWVSRCEDRFNNLKILKR